MGEGSVWMEATENTENTEDGIRNNRDALKAADSECDKTSELYAEMLRETHGCEPYLFCF